MFVLEMELYDGDIIEIQIAGTSEVYALVRKYRPRQYTVYGLSKDGLVIMARSKK